MIKWILKTFKISELKEHSHNPRILSKDDADHIEGSISKFGLIDKPIINLDKTIIGGHQRIKILKRMKVKEVECWIPDQQLDDKKVDELNIRLNKNVGDWDWDILANSFDPLDLVAWGFNAEELEWKDPEEIESEEEEAKDICKCEMCGQEIKSKEKKNGQVNK